MKTPIHSINIDVNTYSEAKELFDYATRKVSQTGSNFWLHVRNQSLEAMNTLKHLEA
ncbi:hypothetical protein [Vibrio bivalvicida]|uniref:Uncharacterized protein n=3 Tax=Vibrionaceae TaxID=641 RepID=A0A0H3ZMN4_9GAMM|nr:hypothetical protein [Enterovibrio norvegicus]AKN37771.1 hypothetical protein [Vibrio sp. FF_482]